MLLFLPDGTQIRPDAVSSAVLRSDLAPIPLTLEAEIRTGEEEIENALAEGKVVHTSTGDAMQIVKSVLIRGDNVQGDRLMSGVRITALLQSCLPLAYVRSRAIIKEKASLAGIYRSAGATIKGIVGDFPVPRFYCYVGETPTFHVSKILQEEGGAVRWKNGRLRFFSLQDMMSQDPIRVVPNVGQDAVETGFLERHTVPWFYSLDDTGAFVFGNTAKARKAMYSPFKNVQHLRNMTRCLVHKKTLKLAYDARIAAGDVIQTTDGERYAVITAAHVFESGADEGQMQNAYTRLWLGQVEE